MMEAIVALGSNLGDREGYLGRALAELSQLDSTRLLAASRVRETDPVDVPARYADLRFLNQAAVFATELSPEEFSHRMHVIETALGRRRGVRNGPRTIDLDLIDFGGLLRRTKELILPHPRATQRVFVSEPIHELGREVTWTLDDVRRALSSGARVLLFVRHAERPRIDNEDPTFGETLPLTPDGADMSRRYGELLRGAAVSVEFRASPLLRTMQTASLIAEGMGLTGAKVVPDEAIGNGCAFVDDALEMWQLFRDGSFFAAMTQYFRAGVQRGFVPIAAGASDFENYALGQFGGQLGIFTTHDVYVAAWLHAASVRTDFSVANWPCFLDAAALVLNADGTRRRVFVRAGLSERCCGVG